MFHMKIMQEICSKIKIINKLEKSAYDFYVPYT